MNASISSLVPHLFMRFMGYFNGIVIIIIIIICGGRWKCHSDGSLSLLLVTPYLLVHVDIFVWVWYNYDKLGPSVQW